MTTILTKASRLLITEENQGKREVKMKSQIQQKISQTVSEKVRKSPK